MNSLIFGIDLGTTNSLIGVFEAGFPGLLADARGDRLTPSALFFSTDGTSPLVGLPALRQRALAPTRTLTSIKRLMGRRFSEIDPEQFAFPVVADAHGRAVVEIDGNIHTPEELSAHLLRHLRQVAAGALTDSSGLPERVVITVPAYFHDAQRAATRLAGEMAGWTVERIISEPTAAALAYGFGRSGEKKRIAVFDLGGGTFDLSILEINDGVFEVLSTRGDTALGGDDIDRLIAAETARRLGWKTTPSSDPLAWGRLHEAAERAKIALSNREETEILLPFLEDERTESLLWNRQDLAQVARPVLDRIPPLCRQALHDARMESADLDSILLVGGSTRMPAVRDLAFQIFGREPDTTQHPDEAIALGACLQGGILGGHTSGLTLLDVTPLSLGLETYGGLMNVLIPRNTSIPCRAGEMFTNAVDHQQEMLLTVLQGEREMARDNWRLGEFCLSFTPAPRGRARVGVEFSIDADGILKVLARDIATGEEQVLRLESAVQVEEARVEAMVEDSLENAFADMNERVFTEAKMKAEELLAALEAAFFQLGETLTASERARLEELADQARAAMEAKDTRTLKSTVEALDEETEPLAALLLEKLTQ